MKKYGFVLDQTDELATEIIECRKCPRLLDHCQAIAQKKVMRRLDFKDQNYWGRPVPNFGRLPADLLVVGLAPGAHGSNRTSRMFTGDDSGLWLYRALHKAGFATTSACTRVGDNRLINCAITSVTHCAPPGNKPELLEINNCEHFLSKTVRLAQPTVILALGGIAWKSALKILETAHDVQLGRGKKRPVFAHGARVKIGDVDVLASYHVSRQNTNTGRLTEPMLDAVLTTARKTVAGK